MKKEYVFWVLSYTHSGGVISLDLYSHSPEYASNFGGFATVKLLKGEKLDWPVLLYLIKESYRKLKEKITPSVIERFIFGLSGSENFEMFDIEFQKA